MITVYHSVERLEFAIVLGEEMARCSVYDDHGARIGWTPYRVAKLASDLIRAGKRLHRMAEDDCNGFHGEGAQEAHDAKVERARARVVAMLKPYGIGATFGDGPLGAVLQLTLPRTKRTNGWGAKGYVVPR